jgi:hypothetical protein
LEYKIARSTSLAQIISKITNPCIVSVLMLLVVAFTESTNVGELVSCGAIILLFFVLTPLVYLYVRTSSSGNPIKSVFELTLYMKQHPKIILILAGLLGLPCLAILWFLEAPTILISILVALVAGSIVTALFNLFYKVSFHLAAITILIIVAAQTWGQIFYLSFVVIPPITWAKYYIHDHTVLQMIIGTALGAIIGLTTSYFLG